jgi:hypothetical protein
MSSGVMVLLRVKYSNPKIKAGKMNMQIINMNIALKKRKVVHLVKRTRNEFSKSSLMLILDKTCWFVGQLYALGFGAVNILSVLGITVRDFINE